MSARPFRQSPGLVALGLLLSLGGGLAAQDDIKTAEGFMRAFEEAVKSENYLGQQMLVRSHRAHAEIVFRQLEYQYAGAVAGAREEQKTTLAGVMNALAEHMKNQLRDEFPTRRMQWIVKLTAEQAAAKCAAMVAIDQKAIPAYRKADMEKSQEAWAEAIAAYATVLESARAAGDDFWAADALCMQGNAYNAQLDYFAAAWCWKQMKAAAENCGAALYFEGRVGEVFRRLESNAVKRMELVDISLPLEEARTRYQEALKIPVNTGDDGGKDARASGGGTGPKRPSVPAGELLEWVEEKPFRFVKEGEKGRPFPTLNACSNTTSWYFWSGLGVKEDSQSMFLFAPGSGEIRNRKGKLFIDLDGEKGTAKEEQLKTSVRPKLWESPAVSYVDGDKNRIAHRMMELPTSFQVKGFAFRNSGEVVNLFVQSAGHCAGKVRGVDVVLIDDNGNGTYNDVDSASAPANYRGTRYTTDCIAVGTGKDRRIQPMSRLVYFPQRNCWYELNVSSSGLKVKSKPYDGPLAQFRFEWKGGGKLRPQAMIARGSGEHSNVFINLMDAIDEPMWIPAGTYEFAWGFLKVDNKDSGNMILVRKGRSGTFDVADTKSLDDNTWRMGGAGKKGYWFAWKADVGEEKGRRYVEVKGKNVSVHGDFGEEYHDFECETPLPVIHASLGNKGAAPFKKEEMRKPEDADVKSGVDPAWYPKDARIEVPGQGDVWLKFEVSYPHFGKISSEPQQVGG